MPGLGSTRPDGGDGSVRAVTNCSTLNTCERRSGRFHVQRPEPRTRASSLQRCYNHVSERVTTRSAPIDLSESQCRRAPKLLRESVYSKSSIRRERVRVLEGIRMFSLPHSNSSKVTVNKSIWRAMTSDCSARLAASGSKPTRSEHLAHRRDLSLPMWAKCSLFRSTLFLAVSLTTS